MAKKAKSSKRATSSRTRAGSRKQTKKDAERVLKTGPIRTRPRDVPLPGMEDHAIAALERGAQAYADIRDQRIELNREESALKQNLLTLMRKHQKTIYKHAGVTIMVQAGEDEVKVKIRKPSEDEDDAETQVENEPADVEAMDSETLAEA